jgi:hypothetical protein
MFESALSASGGNRGRSHPREAGPLLPAPAPLLVCPQAVAEERFYQLYQMYCGINAASSAAGPGAALYS